MSVSWIFDNKFLIPSYSLEILSFKPWEEYINVWKEKIVQKTSISRGLWVTFVFFRSFRKH